MSTFRLKAMRKAAHMLGKLSCANGHVYATSGKTWAELESRPGCGYSRDEILHKVAGSVRAVRDGAFAFERDSVLFHQPKIEHPLMFHLASRYALDRHLHILDAGGSLGSTWWQHRRWLKDIDPNHTWTVVEQEHFVNLGAREFANEHLRFRHRPDQADFLPNVVLISSCIQYIDGASAFLEDMIRNHRGLLIINRHLERCDSGPRRLMLQTVPPSIYPAQYPVWLFERSWLSDQLSSSWTRIDEWESVGGSIWIPDGWLRRIPARYSGSAWIRT